MKEKALDIFAKREDNQLVMFWTDADPSIRSGLRKGKNMHVISRKKLKDFWRKHRQAEGPLKAWYARVRKAKWEQFEDVRQDYASADQVGKFVVFNIAGNKYRLIAAIHYNRQKVYVRHILTHGEYDDDDWKDE